MQLETRLSDLQSQLAASHDSLKVELEEAQKKLMVEQEAKAKLTDSNQSYKKVRRKKWCLIWVHLSVITKCLM